jgi:hypothetical protein
VAEFSPFPELTFEELETLQNLDPEQELQTGYSAVVEAYPFGVSPRINFELGDFEVSEGGVMPLIDGKENLSQWAMATCLTEKFESPLLSEAVGMEVRAHIGETITSSLLMLVAGQVPQALKAHDRIAKVFVQRVFSIANDIYIIARYETDDEQEDDFLVRVGG